MLAFHRRALVDHKRKEAIWKRSISQSHSLWCNCGNYLRHLIKCPTVADTGLGGVSPAEGISFATEEEEDGCREEGAALGEEDPSR
nr:MAG: ORF2 [Torque teno polar bear virus 28]WBM82701.1 MAG: ORF2 [Torque teno polar bear virus 32]